jgi:uncharacterized coiled-coil protein SlyX
MTDPLPIFRAYFDALSRRFDDVAERLTAIENRLGNLEHRMTGLEQQMVGLSRMYVAVQDRVDKHGRRLGDLERRLDDEIVRRVDPGRDAPP